MTLEGWIKKWLRGRHPEDFPHDGPRKADLMSTDMMQWFKSSLPPHVTNSRMVIVYFRNRILGLFNLSPVNVVIVDYRSPEVKEIVCYKTRGERRCKTCKKLPRLPRGRTVYGPEYFSPECTAGCEHKQVLWYEEGPHLDRMRLPEDYLRFSADSRNLRCELFPRVADEILAMAFAPGQLLLVHGLPFREVEVMDYEECYKDGHVRGPTKRTVVAPWGSDFDRDEVVYTEDTYEFSAHARGRPVEAMRHAIHEADNSIFFYSQFFPQARVQVFNINDGDAILIGLLRALEELRGGEPQHELWLRMPFLEDREGKFFSKGARPTHTHVNLTGLAKAIDDAPEMKAAGVQAPVATVVFLGILAGTDFFPKESLKGMGARIQDTLFERLDHFSHLVQYYTPEKSLTAPRRFVLDEELFVQFVHFLHIDKQKTLKKFENTTVTIEMVRAHCASHKTGGVPSDVAIRAMGRRALYNADYWARAWRNQHVDPFERFLDASYYGFDGETRTLTDHVSRKQKDVDEVHKRHFWKRKQHQRDGGGGPPDIPAVRKKAALDLIKGK